MKWIRFGLVPVLVLTLATVALADEKTATTKPASASKGHGDWNKSPEDMAKQQTEKWSKTLKLTDAQKPQFESVMKDSYQKMADARTAAAGDKDKMKDSMKSIMEDRDAALEKVLTPDQMKIYHEKMEKMKSEGKKKWDKAKEADKDEKDEKK